MNIAILGVGAIGGVIGGYLANNDYQPTLIDLWPENIAHIKTNGITVTGIGEEFTANAKALHLGEVSSTRQFFDMVIISVKSYDTAWATKFIQPYLAPEGFIVSAQNGINEDEIASIVGWNNVIGCIVTIGAGMYSPGHVHRTSPSDKPSFILGEPNGIISPRLETTCAIFNNVGPSKKTTNLWGERWSKLTQNCMVNALSGITGLSSAEVRRNSDSSTILIKLAIEIIQVVNALGVEMKQVNGITTKIWLESENNTEIRNDLKNTLVKTVQKTFGEGRPSLSQDIIKGRKIEIDSLNGYVVRQAKKTGLSVPLNKAIIKVSKLVEAGDLEPSLLNLEYLEI